MAPSTRNSPRKVDNDMMEETKNIESNKREAENVSEKVEPKRLKTTEARGSDEGGKEVRPDANVYGDYCIIIFSHSL